MARSRGPTAFSEAVVAPLRAVGRWLAELLGDMVLAGLACLILAGIIWGWHQHRAVTVALLAVAALSVATGAVVLWRASPDDDSRLPLWAALAVASTLGFGCWLYYVSFGCWVCTG